MARAGIFPGNNWAREKNPADLRCWRCKGLMIAESSFERIGEGIQSDCLTRRCVQCGEVVDPVILQNRRLQSEKNLARV